MPSAKLAAALVLAALSLTACGIASKPEAGTPNAITNGHKGLDDARSKHTACLKQANVAFHNEQLTIAGKVLPSFQVESAPAGPTVSFEPTPGDAQGVQIQGEAQGAEIIGSAVVFPNQAPDSLLTTVERCAAWAIRAVIDSVVLGLMTLITQARSDAAIRLSLFFCALRVRRGQSI